MQYVEVVGITYREATYSDSRVCIRVLSFIIKHIFSFHFLCVHFFQINPFRLSYVDITHLNRI